MVNTAPFGQVQFGNNRTANLVKPTVTFKPALIVNSNIKQNTAPHHAPLGNPVLMEALIGIIILVKLLAQTRLRHIKQQKWSTKRKNSKKSVKKRVTQNLHKYDIPPIQ